MFKKILKWTGLVLLGLILTITVVTASRQNLKFDAPYPDVTASTDSAVIERGRHLVTGPAHCAECHSRSNADSLLQLGQYVALSGGVEFTMPLGTLYTPNITPDKETGIGNYSDRELARALRYGVHPDGRAVYDFMPFHNVSDEDLGAILSYIRSQPPVHNPVPKNDLNVMGKLVNAFLVKPVGPEGNVPRKISEDTSALYGQYLVKSLANCGGCHTPRGMGGEFVGDYCSGGDSMREKGGTFLPPNLTQYPGGRIYGWSEKDFINRFRMGKLIPGSPMPWNYFKRMNDTELKAIYNYLKSLKPSPGKAASAAK